MRHLALPCLLPLLLSGCEPPGEAETSHQSSREAPRQVEQTEAYQLTVGRDSPGMINTSSEEVSEPTEDDIRQLFASIDWDDPEERSSIALARTGPQFSQISMKRHSEYGLMMILIESAGSAGQTYLYADHVSADEALQAFLSLRNDDDQYRTMLVWKDEDEF